MTTCSASAGARELWAAAQGKKNNFYEDSPDIIDYTNNVPGENDIEKEFYFGLVDYVCGASFAREGSSAKCNSTVVSLDQICDASGVTVRVVLDVRNANAFVGTLTWRTYAAANYNVKDAAKIKNGCRLNQNTKTPSTSTPGFQNCGSATEWQDWLATSRGRFTFTYRIVGGSCSCQDPSLTANYNYDLIDVFDGSKITQVDNDVNFGGKGFFNYGTEASEAAWAGVAGTHRVAQVLSGTGNSCGEQCILSTRGIVNLQINPVGGDYLSIRATMSKDSSRFLLSSSTASQTSPSSPRGRLSCSRSFNRPKRNNKMGEKYVTSSPSLNLRRNK